MLPPCASSLPMARICATASDMRFGPSSVMSCLRVGALLRAISMLFPDLSGSVMRDVQPAMMMNLRPSPAEASFPMQVPRWLASSTWAFIMLTGSLRVHTGRRASLMARPKARRRSTMCLLRALKGVAGGDARRGSHSMALIGSSRITCSSLLNALRALSSPMIEVFIGLHAFSLIDGRSGSARHSSLLLTPAYNSFVRTSGVLSQRLSDSLSHLAPLLSYSSLLYLTLPLLRQKTQCKETRREIDCDACMVAVAASRALERNSSVNRGFFALCGWLGLRLNTLLLRLQRCVLMLLHTPAYAPSFISSAPSPWSASCTRLPRLRTLPATIAISIALLHGPILVYRHRLLPHAPSLSYLDSSAISRTIANRYANSSDVLIVQSGRA